MLNSVELKKNLTFCSFEGVGGGGGGGGWGGLPRKNLKTKKAGEALVIL